MYLKEGSLAVEIIKGEWIDAGTFESLYRASKIAREHRLETKTKSKLKVKIRKIKKTAQVRTKK